MARNQKKLVQTALDNVMPPLPFNQIQYAEIGDWRGEPDHPAWLKVKESLTALCRAAGETAKSTKRTAAARPRPCRQASRRRSGNAARKQALRQRLRELPAAAAELPGVLYGVVGAVAAVLVLGVVMGFGAAIPTGRGRPPGGAAAFSRPPRRQLRPRRRSRPASPRALLQPSDAQDRHVIIMNTSSQPLLQLYASPVTSDNWEEDLLGSGAGAGASINANIDNGTSECSST